MTKLRKFVLVNKEILITLGTNFDKPDIMKELFKRQENLDRVIIPLSMRGLLQEAFSEELEEQITFLTYSILPQV